MIKLEKTQVVGWEPAIRGMRNPMNSWDKSDSKIINMTLKSVELAPGVDSFEYQPCDPYMSIGTNDHELMMKLAKGGPVHAKYRRMITVYVDITAPLYWWKEFDTYKVGTVANSCSTMHKIHAKEFTREDFSCEHLDRGCTSSTITWGLEVFDDSMVLDLTIAMLNHKRKKFLETKDKEYWDDMIQLLPSSYNQKRTVEMNYEVLAGLYPMRKNHKLEEWHVFCDWIEKLPYSEIIIGEKEKEND